MKTKTKKTGRVMRRTTAAERNTLLQEYRQSGLSRREFAQRKGINLMTFHCWFRKHPVRVTENRSTTEFVKLALSEVSENEISIVVKCSSGLRIHIHGLGVQEVATLLREVVSC